MSARAGMVGKEESTWFSKTTAERANSSRWGVWMKGLPYVPRWSRRNVSETITTKLWRADMHVVLLRRVPLGYRCRRGGARRPARYCPPSRHPLLAKAPADHQRIRLRFPEEERSRREDSRYGSCNDQRSRQRRPTCRLQGPRDPSTHACDTPREPCSQRRSSPAPVLRITESSPITEQISYVV